jgi:protein tyrosine phosphatase (PTP) superfamily phosphohydrolase (DUF442 family)
MRLALRPWLPTFALLVALTACGDAPSPRATPDVTEGPGAAPAPTLATAAALGVPNAHEPVPGLLTAGQPSPEQMRALAAAGYTRFISLRLPEEGGAGWEEAFAAENGVSFTRLPIRGADDLSMANVEALDRILDEAGEAPTVLYCGSANRVGALLALRAHWLDGVAPDAALEFGKSAGMTRLEPDVLQRLGTGAGGR